MVEKLAKKYNVPVHSFNSSGIRVEWSDEAECRMFKEMLNGMKCVSWSKKCVEVFGLALADFYTMCDNIGIKCMITVGRDMLTRGITCASKNTLNPLAAVTMIYTPSATSYAVSVNQVLGRICGSVRPDLTRRVFTTEAVWKMYIGYNESQEKCIAAFLDPTNNGKISSAIIDDTPVKKFGQMERKILRAEYKNFEVEITPPGYDNNDNNRMKQLVDNWYGKSTIIGKIFTFVYESEVGVSETELKEYIKEIGSENTDKMFKELVRKDAEHNTVFERTSNNITKLRKDALEYTRTK
jgi:hypothetical protein